MHTNRNFELNLFQPRRSVASSFVNEQKGAKYTKIENPEEFENPEHGTLQTNLIPPSKKKKRRLPGETLLKKYALQYQQKKKFKMSTDSNDLQRTTSILPENTMTGSGAGGAEHDDTDQEEAVEEKKTVQVSEQCITPLDALHVLIEHLMKAILRGSTKDNPRKAIAEARKILMNSFLPVLALSRDFKSLTTEDEVKSFVSAASEQVADAMEEILDNSEMKEETTSRLKKGLSRALSQNSKKSSSKVSQAIKQVANKTGRSIQKSLGGPPVSRLNKR
jgi:hypothetical protein